VRNTILLPALDLSAKMKYIDSNELKILRITIEKQVIQNSDIQSVLKEKHTTSILATSWILKERMLVGEFKKSRRYHISLTNSFLIRSVINKLENEGFVPSI
jgi:hypothetical protein